MQVSKWRQSTTFSCLSPCGKRVDMLPGGQERAHEESWGLPSSPPWPWAGGTFVVMPDSQLAEVAQAQHVREVECVCVVPLKLVPIGWLLQGQGPAVPILPKDDDEHIGIGACSWGAKTEALGASLSNAQPTDSGLHPGFLGRASGADGKFNVGEARGEVGKGWLVSWDSCVSNSILHLVSVPCKCCWINWSPG